MVRPGGAFHVSLVKFCTAMLRCTRQPRGVLITCNPVQVEPFPTPSSELSAVDHQSAGTRCCCPCRKLDCCAESQIRTGYL